LINAKPAENNAQSPDLGVVTLKRLNFLKQSLEAHDPKDTTARLRILANQKRDDRMLELWKQDQEGPSIAEMVK
jgi:anti-sigma-K factor RskA